MKKTRRLSSMLVLTLVIAVPSTHAYALDLSVEQAVKEMQYAITTEWDQKDAKKQKEIYRAFSEKIEAIEGSGVSQEEIARQLKMLALTKQQEKDIDAVTRYITTNKLPKKDALALLVKTMRNSSMTEGTSWNPPERNINWGLIVGLTIGAFLVFAIVASAIECNKHPERCTCEGDGCGSSDGDSGDGDGWDDDWDDGDGGEDCTTDEYGDVWCWY